MNTGNMAGSSRRGRRRASGRWRKRSGSFSRCGPSRGRLSTAGISTSRTDMGLFDRAVIATRLEHWLLARNAAAVAAKRERLAARGPLRGFVGTVSEAIDLIGQYQDAGLFVSDIMPHFA